MDRLEREMPADLYLRWYAYSVVNPFGENRADVRAGIVAATVHNTLVGLWAKNPKFKKPADFMPKYGIVKVKKTAKDIYEIFKAAIKVSTKLIDKRDHDGN